MNFLSNGSQLKIGKFYLWIMALPITCNAKNYTPIVQHIVYFKTLTVTHISQLTTKHWIILNITGASKDEEKDDVEDEVVMNNLMHDIKEGFIQRRLPDGGFKVVIIYIVDVLTFCHLKPQKMKKIWRADNPLV